VTERRRISVRDFGLTRLANTSYLKFDLTLRRVRSSPAERRGKKEKTLGSGTSIRHSPLVGGMCRGRLRTPADAEGKSSAPVLGSENKSDHCNGNKGGIEEAASGGRWSGGGGNLVLHLGNKREEGSQS